MLIYCPPGYRLLELTCSECGRRFQWACPIDDADAAEADGECDAVCDDCGDLDPDD